MVSLNINIPLVYRNLKIKIEKKLLAPANLPPTANNNVNLLI